MLCLTRWRLFVGLALLPVLEANIDVVEAPSAVQLVTPASGVDTKKNKHSGTNQAQKENELQAFNAQIPTDSVRKLPVAGLKPGSKHAELVNELRASVVRIEKIETVMNWFAPYGDTRKSASVGTGFAVKLLDEDQETPPNTDEDPIFITNAHVARNAENLRLQLSAIGQRSFGAHVPVIYDVHDLAIVKLDQTKEFMQYLKENKVTLRVLRVRKHDVSLGLSVIAIGFPLGSQTLKLSMGVIAGTESFEGHTVYQCTAPISPGNSGGPLLQVSDKEDVDDAVDVVGVNFAAIPDHAA
jgi:S1-C subfamily serine protease